MEKIPSDYLLITLLFTSAAVACSSLMSYFVCFYINIIRYVLHSFFICTFDLVQQILFHFRSSVHVFSFQYVFKYGWFLLDKILGNAITLRCKSMERVCRGIMYVCIFYLMTFFPLRSVYHH
jgi:cell shape-determining protein MreD